MNRSPLLTGGIVAALAVSLAGCAGGSSQASSAQGDNVVVAVGALPDSLTPSPWGGSASHVVLSGLGSQLLQYKTDENSCERPSTDVTSKLAESAEPNADGTGIIVKLRKLTSQFGNTLSAEDVRWSLDIGMKRQPVMKGTLKSSGFDVDNLVTVIDDRTVQLNTTEITSYTIEALQNNLFYIHDSTEAKKHATADDPTANNWLSRNLADYSGWELEEFTPGTTLTVTADPDWTGERGDVKRVVVKAVPSTATRSQLVESGEVQVANAFEYDQYESLKRAPGVSVADCASQTRDTLMFNTKAGPLSDEKVRHAISMAIDREALVKGAYAGYGEPAGSIFPMVEGSDIYKFDTAGARKLLAEAGYADGFPLTLSYSETRPGPVAAKTAVLIQSMLKEVGIDVELKNVASATDFSTALIDGRYQAVLYAEPIVISDPAYYSYAFYGTGAPSNSTGWSDPKFDKARAELAATPDEEADKRADLLNEMAALVDKGAPILSLVEVRGMLAQKEGLSGVLPLTNGQIYFNALGR
ncbi:ABC transporter substrate-binding protein [Arthrobacter sp. GCM10027362]|uniref:ABC transporter substrate-binding protein n=1 Tax=Arthrobacter sp. GCM10027362 TaxID=3273379 RepID=UPI003637DDC5